MGLAEARYRKLGTYSLGMKQLAKLAQAIVHGPKLLILDEPTNGLDPSARQRMIRMIREMRDTGQCGFCCARICCAMWKTPATKF